MRGPGLTLNYKAWDTFFSIIDTDKQIVVPSNKQRLSKVWVLFLDEAAQNDNEKDAFRKRLVLMIDVCGVDPVQLRGGAPHHHRPIGVSLYSPPCRE